MIYRKRFVTGLHLSEQEIFDLAKYMSAYGLVALSHEHKTVVSIQGVKAVRKLLDLPNWFGDYFQHVKKRGLKEVGENFTDYCVLAHAVAIALRIVKTNQPDLYVDQVKAILEDPTL